MRPKAKGTQLFHSLRVSAFVPAPNILEFELPDPTYIQSLQHSLEFTLPHTPIVLFQYCPVISIVHIASKASRLSTFTLIYQPSYR